MAVCGCEVLDHGDDPGRYTVIYFDGRILTVNETGKVLFQRKCHKPSGIIYELSRQTGIHILKPSRVPLLLKKIELFLTPEQE
ncbi:hypothetical protein GO755_38980 [Spirosoma sp. HMF4905]|uniref:Uncharacterized protein n=1 Tax=Spirosoma arboris TaxID=2682092 RepID=A0A7K1SQU0_9BACT|nr:hypothetical protein [Spirosoma arboris]MVM36063.1 hypothetical protein [Spirosoma arboris]